MLEENLQKKIEQKSYLIMINIVVTKTLSTLLSIKKIVCKKLISYFASSPKVRRMIFKWKDKISNNRNLKTNMH